MYKNECLKGLNILIVEDIYNIREIFASILNSFGANVTESFSIDNALHTLIKVNPDLVISDINLPDGNGCALIVQIKEIMKSKGKDIKGLAITGLLDNKHKETFLKAGFEEYLCRPFEPDNLIKVVAGMADKDCS